MPAVSERQRRFFGAELARKRAGQRTDTGLSEDQLKDFAKKAKHNTKLMSPRGDVDTYNEGERRRAFPKPIKGGKTWSAVKAIPWRGTDAMVGDAGSGVREAPKDKVV